MRTWALTIVLTLAILLIGPDSGVHAQHSQAGGPQIPTLQVCNLTRASGFAVVRIGSRSDATHTGTFGVEIRLGCDPAGTGYPTGTLTITGISMNDSLVSGSVTATTFEQVTSTGRVSPTVYLNGRCMTSQFSGCHYWLMITDNTTQKGIGAVTPDAIGFLVFNGLGVRIAYGTGCVVQGHITVAPTAA